MNKSISLGAKIICKKCGMVRGSNRHKCNPNLKIIKKWKQLKMQ